MFKIVVYQCIRDFKVYLQVSSERVSAGKLGRRLGSYRVASILQSAHL